MIDTIPHIIDTSRIIIQNIIPGKSNFEIYAPYISVIVSLVALIVSIVMSYVQISANRKQMRFDNMIKLRKEWIQDFSQLMTKILNELLSMSIYVGGRSFEKESEDFDKVSNHRDKIFFYQSELILKVTLEGETFDGLYKLLSETCGDIVIHSVGMYDTKEEFETGSYTVQRRAAEFQVIVRDIIMKENKKLLKIE